MERKTLSGSDGRPSLVLSLCSPRSSRDFCYLENGVEALREVFGALNVTQCLPELCFAYHTWKMAL